MSELHYVRRECCGTMSRQRHLPDCQRDESMCGVKTGFETRSATERQAERMETRTDRHWRAYRCPYCGLWHLTTHMT